MAKLNNRPTGQTRDTGFQIGSRRTFNLPAQAAWGLVTSLEGVNLWLGPVSEFSFKKGASYKLRDGSGGEIRVFFPGSHLRLTWQPPAWPRAQPSSCGLFPRVTAR